MHVAANDFKNLLFTFDQPAVLKSPNSDTYAVFGERSPKIVQMAFTMIELKTSSLSSHYTA
jgi:hypothetical protein